MRAQFVLFDDFDPLDVIAPYGVLYGAGTAAVVRSDRGPGTGADR